MSLKLGIISSLPTELRESSADEEGLFVKSIADPLCFRFVGTLATSGEGDFSLESPFLVGSTSLLLVVAAKLVK